MSLMEEQHVTLLYYRHNITEQLIADMVGIHEAYAKFPRTPSEQASDQGFCEALPEFCISLHQSTVSGTIALVKAMLNVVVDDEQPHVEAALGETNGRHQRHPAPWADTPELYSRADKTTGHTRP